MHRDVGQRDDEPEESPDAVEGGDIPLPLDYARPRRRWGFRGLFDESAIAETLIGIGWTCCGFSTLMTAFYLAVFGRGMLWPLVLICLVLNAIGASLCVGSLVFRPWQDVLLRNLLIATLVVAWIGGVMQAMWFV